MKEPIKAAAVVFGEVLFDRFPGGRAVLGGAPFNVAWNLKAMKAEPLLVSRVGQDELGDRIFAAMDAWEMDTRGLQVDARHPTGTVEVTIQNGEPAYEIAADKAYDFIAAEELFGLGQAGLLYHGSLALRCELSRQTLARLRHDLVAPVFLDVNLRAPWWRREEVLELMSRARWVKLNEAELAELLPETGTTEARARLVFERMAPECLIVTRGEKGVWFADRQGRVIQAAVPAASQVVDTVGAGDAFSSVVMLGLLQEWEWTVILKRAMAFAAGVVGLQGATTTDRAFYASFTRDWEPS